MTILSPPKKGRFSDSRFRTSYLDIDFVANSFTFWLEIYGKLVIFDNETMCSKIGDIGYISNLVYFDAITCRRWESRKWQDAAENVYQGVWDHSRITKYISRPRLYNYMDVNHAGTLMHTTPHFGVFKSSSPLLFGLYSTENVLPVHAHFLTVLWFLLH